MGVSCAAFFDNTTPPSREGFAIFRENAARQTLHASYGVGAQGLYCEFSGDETKNSQIRINKYR